jgi:hypothetical protein
MSNYRQEIFNNDLGWGICHLRDLQKWSNLSHKIIYVIRKLLGMLGKMSCDQPLRWARWQAQHDGQGHSMTLRFGMVYSMT